MRTFIVLARPLVDPDGCLHRNNSKSYLRSILFVQLNYIIEGKPERKR